MAAFAMPREDCFAPGPLKMLASALAMGSLLAGCAGAPSATQPVAGGAGQKDYFISLQDGRAGLSDGKPQVRNAPNSLAVVELAGNRLRLIQRIEMPTSLVGPPNSI